MRGLTVMPEALVTARNQLLAAEHGTRMQVLEEIARLFGRSTSQTLRMIGPLKTRKRRSDAGSSALSASDLDAVASHLLMSQRKTGKILSCVADAKEDLLRSGLITAEVAAVSDATWARQLRRRGISADLLKRPSLATELDSRAPNDWHLVDASIGILFYLSPKGTMQFKRVDLMDPKNKPEQFAKHVSTRLLLIRWVLVDHYSGAAVVDYREAAGENTADLVEFLHYCWAPKNDPRWPMMGVPHHLYADQGAPQKSSHIQSLSERLEFQVHLHQSSHTRHDAPAARATGMVETHMRVWEHAFESRWRHNPPTGGIEQVRAEARDFCILFNSGERYRNPHTKLTRSELWMDIEDSQIRLPPTLEAFKEAAISAPARRVLDAYGRIQFDGQLFKIPSCPWYPGEGLQVRRIIHDAERLEVLNPRTGESLDALRLTKRRNGRSSAATYLGETQHSEVGQPGAHQPQHAAARLRVSQAEDVHAKTGMATPGSIDTGLGRMADTVAVNFIPRTGAPILPVVSGRRIDAWDAMALAADRLQRTLTRAEADWLSEQIGERRVDEGVALEHIESLAMQAGETRKVLTFGGAR